MDEELREFLELMRQESAAARQHTDTTAAETRRLLQTSLSEIHARLENVATISHVDSVATETRRHFDVVAEGGRRDSQLLAESVSHLSNRLDRTDEKIERTAAETQSMIRFSHAELDRRLRSLEDVVAQLQARVERLESSSNPS